MTNFHTVNLILEWTRKEPHSHQLFIKTHEITKREARARPKDRTLFVLNVPPYIEADNLRNAFEDAGELEEVTLCERPDEIPDEFPDSTYFPSRRENFVYKCAFLVFKTSRGLQNALKLTRVASGPIRCGLAKWCEDYLKAIPDPVRLQTEIDSYIAGYDEQMQKRDEEIVGEPDDDGWVTVTKKSHPVIEKKESIFNRIEAKEQKRKGKTELKDFYRFQLKDSKVKQLAQLRKRFDEDKKKVEVLRNSRRKFKPI